MAGQLIHLPGCEDTPAAEPPMVCAVHPAYDGLTADQLAAQLRHDVTMLQDSDRVALSWFVAGLRQARERAASGT